MSTNGNRLQVSASRYYRIAWAGLTLFQALALIPIVQRVPIYLWMPLVVLQGLLLVLSFSVPQLGSILRWSPGYWWLWSSGRWQPAQLSGSVVLFPWLTCFTLTSDRKRHFLLFADSADAADLHKLRVALALSR